MNTMENNNSTRLGLGGKTRMQADLVAAMLQNLTAREARLMRLRYTAFRLGRPDLWRNAPTPWRFRPDPTTIKECFEKAAETASGISQNTS
jgi:hypothetical protein